MWACSPSPGRISCAFKANKARNGQTHPVVGSKMKRFRFRNSVNPEDEDAFNASDLSDAKQYFLRHRGKGMQPADGGVAYISFEIDSMVVDDCGLPLIGARYRHEGRIDVHTSK